ncbi:MAG: 4-(cytidine 5'-diphospho)-2-C-methyl-D-erythritol kinase [Acidimicrobiia bacterium]
MMQAQAFAKVNLALVVYPRAADGFHPLSGIFQSISLSDTIAIADARSDSVRVSNDEAPADMSNLAFAALDAVRRAARVSLPMSIEITKRIPAGAGLGGGSADAAATLGLMAKRFRLDEDTISDIATSLGSDVPFSYVGGSCRVEGRGDRISPMKPLDNFALAVVVPPFALGTPEVFRRWDELGGPVGDVMSDSALPPALRGGEPLRNDLYPAAASLDERIVQWRDELQTRWGTEVAMTGSGSALFAYFGSMDEAADAASVVDLPNRAAEAVSLVPTGWE